MRKKVVGSMLAMALMASAMMPATTAVASEESLLTESL